VVELLIKLVLSGSITFSLLWPGAVNPITVLNRKMSI